MSRRDLLLMFVNYGSGWKVGAGAFTFERTLAIKNEGTGWRNRSPAFRRVARPVFAAGSGHPSSTTSFVDVL